MKIQKKLLSNRGESLVEVLVAIIILTLAMTVLASGLSSATKVTSAIPVEDTVFKTDGSTTTCTVTITIGNQSASMTRTGHASQNGYFYYD